MTLAQRITAWTSKGILTAVIVVAGLAFGRQVLRWWADAPGETEPAVSAAVDPTDDDETQPRLLRFGNLKWSVACRSVSGTREEAAGALERACREAIGRAELPAEAPGPAETRLLATLAAQRPAAEEPGRWRLDALDEGLPMVVGARPGVPAGAASRVVLWGVAMPASPQTWTLYTCVSGRGVGTTCTATVEVPAPPDSVNILSISTDDGGRMETFSGQADWVTWRDFYDRRLTQLGWRRVGGWDGTRPGWHGRFRPAEPDRPGAVHIQLTTDDRGRTTGLVLITPAKLEP